MTFLLMAHSVLRWIILLVAVIAVVKFVVGWRRSGGFKAMERGLTSGFSGLMDLQATLGVIFCCGMALRPRLVSRGIALSTGL